MGTKPPGRWGIALRGTAPAPQSKPVTPTSRLVAQVAPSVAFRLGLSVLAAGPAATDTTPIVRAECALDMRGDRSRVVIERLLDSLTSQADPPSRSATGPMQTDEDGTSFVPGRHGLDEEPVVLN